MDTFDGADGVRVVRGPDRGKTGHVGRRRTQDAGACFVALDSPPAPTSRLFEPDDRRANQVLLYPEDCELLR